MKQILTGIFICTSLISFGQENKDLQDKIDGINSNYNELIGTDNNSIRSTGAKSEIKYAKYLEKSMEELIKSVDIMRLYFQTHNSLSMEYPIANIGGQAVSLRDELKGSLDYNAAGLKNGTINFKIERDNSIILWTNFFKAKNQYYEKEDDVRSGRAAQRENQQRKEDSTKKSLSEKEKYSLFKESIKNSFAGQTIYLCNSRTSCVYVRVTMQWKPTEKSSIICAFVLDKDKTQLNICSGSDKTTYPITEKQFDKDKNVWKFTVLDKSGSEKHIVEINLDKNVIYSYYDQDYTNLYYFDIIEEIK